MLLEQTTLYDAIVEINNKITILKEQNGARSPLIQSYTHKRGHGRLGHNYESTLAHGLHFNDHYKGHIGARIVDTFYYNLHATCN